MNSVEESGAEPKVILLRFFVWMASPRLDTRTTSPVL